MPKKVRKVKERRLRGKAWHLKNEIFSGNRLILHLVLTDNNLYTKTEVRKLLAEYKARTGLFIRR